MNFVQLADYMNYALAWVGFGAVLGVIALIVVPGKDGGGSVATVLMGIAGTLLGCAILQYFSFDGVGVLPVSTQGFTVGSGGAIVLLLFYKVLGGAYFIDQGRTLFRHQRRRRRRFTTDLDD